MTKRRLGAQDKDALGIFNAGVLEEERAVVVEEREDGARRVKLGQRSWLLRKQPTLGPVNHHFRRMETGHPVKNYNNYFTPLLH